MILILWRYTVRPAARADFVRTYGPAGAWAALFARGEGFLGTGLWRGPGDTFLTVDRWRRAADFEAFMAGHRAAYEALDRATAGWTVEETRLGLWDDGGESVA